MTKTLIKPAFEKTENGSLIIPVNEPHFRRTHAHYLLNDILRAKSRRVVLHLRCNLSDFALMPDLSDLIRSRFVFTYCEGVVLGNIWLALASARRIGAAQSTRLFGVCDRVSDPGETISEAEQQVRCDQIISSIAIGRRKRLSKVETVLDGGRVILPTEARKAGLIDDANLSFADFLKEIENA